MPILDRDQLDKAAQDGGYDPFRLAGVRPGAPRVFRPESSGWTSLQADSLEPGDVILWRATRRGIPDERIGVVTGMSASGSYVVEVFEKDDQAKSAAARLGRNFPSSRIPRGDGELSREEVEKHKIELEAARYQVRKASRTQEDEEEDEDEELSLEEREARKVERAVEQSLRLAKVREVADKISARARAEDAKNTAILASSTKTSNKVLSQRVRDEGEDDEEDNYKLPSKPVESADDNYISELEALLAGDVKREEIVRKTAKVVKLPRKDVAKQLAKKDKSYAELVPPADYAHVDKNGSEAAPAKADPVEVEYAANTLLKSGLSSLGAAQPTREVVAATAAEGRAEQSAGESSRDVLTTHRYGASSRRSGPVLSLEGRCVRCRKPCANLDAAGLGPRCAQKMGAFRRAKEAGDTRAWETATSRSYQSLSKARNVIPGGLYGFRDQKGREVAGRLLSVDRRSGEAVVETLVFDPGRPNPRIQKKTIRNPELRSLLGGRRLEEPDVESSETAPVEVKNVA